MSNYTIKERPTTVDGEWRDVGQVEAHTPGHAARAAARYAVNALKLAGRFVEAKAVRTSPR